jgi:hypothetical protein
MNKIAIAALLALTLVLGACGSGSSTNNGNINGNWTAQLTDTHNDPVFALTTTFTQMSGSAVSVTNLTFTTSTPFFVSGESGTGSFILSGNFNGNVTGAFQLTITSGNPSGDTLTLQGTAKSNVITGTWTLTGLHSGCSGKGNFTLNKM